MPIDIDGLSEDELRDLHHRVTERLRMIQQLRAHGAMLKFSIGDRVSFEAEGRRIVGVITRYNKKTVTIIADGGLRWNVSPGFLQRVVKVEVEQEVGRGRPVTRPASHLLTHSGRAREGRA